MAVVDVIDVNANIDGVHRQVPSALVNGIPPETQIDYRRWPAGGATRTTRGVDTASNVK